MRLTQNTLKKINTKEIRPLLALALKKSEGSILRYIADNDENLTKAAAMNVIREQTGLTDADILEVETATA